jgi:putative Mn2+ efflux pump MntP
VDLLIIALIAVGLSADAFAVAVARSLADKKFNLQKSVLIAGYFGFFQAVMPVIGWFLGIQLLAFASGIDHWIAFLLLLFVGGKMIYESRLEASGELDQKTLLVLSVATSIDALAIGLTFSFLGIMVIEAAIVIGMITFIISLAGCLIGRRFGRILNGKMGVLGGIVLIIIGIKILFEHSGFL